MPESDAVGVARAEAGDPDAFRDLVDRHSRRIYRLAFRMTGNAQDAEDAVQEALLRAYKQLRPVRVARELRDVAPPITVNCSIDLMRARSQERERKDQDEEAPRTMATPQGNQRAGTAGAERRDSGAGLPTRGRPQPRWSAPPSRCAISKGMSIDEIGACAGTCEAERDEAQHLSRGPEDAHGAGAVRDRGRAELASPHGTVTHQYEDDLVLHYYGELRGLRGRLARASPGASATRAARASAVSSRCCAPVDEAPVPEPSPEFERAVWTRLRPRAAGGPAGAALGLRPTAHGFGLMPRWAFAGGIAALVVIAFLTGALWRQTRPQPEPTAPPPVGLGLGGRHRRSSRASAPGVVGEHLERSGARARRADERAGAPGRGHSA